MHMDKENLQKRLKAVQEQIKNLEAELKPLLRNEAALLKRLEGEQQSHKGPLIPLNVQLMEAKYHAVRQWYQSKQNKLKDGSAPLNEFFYSVNGKLNYAKKEENWNYLLVVLEKLISELESQRMGLRQSIGNMNNILEEEK